MSEKKKREKNYRACKVGLPRYNTKVTLLGHLTLWSKEGYRFEFLVCKFCYRNRRKNWAHDIIRKNFIGPSHVGFDGGFFQYGQNSAACACTVLAVLSPYKCDGLFYFINTIIIQC